MSENPLSDTLDVVMFSAGGWCIGLEARLVGSARPVEQNTGVCANVGDGIMLESLLGLPLEHVPSPARRQWLEIKDSHQPWQLQVSGPVELRPLAIGRIHPLPPLLAARNQLPGLRAIVLQEAQQIALLFDASALKPTLR